MGRLRPGASGMRRPDRLDMRCPPAELLERLERFRLAPPGTRLSVLLRCGAVERWVQMEEGHPGGPRRCLHNGQPKRPSRNQRRFRRWLARNNPEGGERIVVLHKRWAGIPASCHDDRTFRLAVSRAGRAHPAVGDAGAEAGQPPHARAPAAPQARPSRTVRARRTWGRP